MYVDDYRQDLAEYDKLDGDFISDMEIWAHLERWAEPRPAEVGRVLEKAAQKVRLEPGELAILLQTRDQAMRKHLYELAHQLKREIYGERLVFFAPLYLSNQCANNCSYCGFRTSNALIHRRVLNNEEIQREVAIMIDEGQKRTVLVYGESPESGIGYITESVRQVYQVTRGKGRIRRANINCAPLRREELRCLKEVGIGTYQVFQETYHHDTYRRVHPADTLKGHYRWRLYAHDRALDAGVDDVGIGALFGLYDWRFEAMGLLYHTIHLEQNYNGVGPHTISFPRIEPALGTPYVNALKYRVSDADFKHLVACLRLAVPYTGMILTARERPEVRREVIPLGISQIDAGTRIGVGGYQQSKGNEMPEHEQFQLGDIRTLDDVVRETCQMGDIPSFCTACYRKGRTGEHFMGLAKTSFVKNFCMPNALSTLKEYLLGYATPETRRAGEAAIQAQLEGIEDSETKAYLIQAFKKLEAGETDQYL